ncbi:hypothetical protein LJC01_02410 [Clostridiaceae bacterium OttesenSCG-928-D20]|nr:hypothetical protein [Clostridiaceae bacterium OttesenSCG-928-D20]
MLSKKSYFNRAIFVKNLKRFWPMIAMYFALWLLIMPINFSSVVHYLSANDVREYASSLPLQAATATGTVIAFIAGIAGAMAVWSYLCNNRISNGMAVLPVSREAMFTSNVLSVLLSFIAVHFVCFGLAYLVELFYGITNITALFQGFAIISMLTVIFFSIGTFCAMISSNIVMIPILYVVVNFLSVISIPFINAVLEEFNFGFSGIDTTFLTYLSPFTSLVSNINVETRLVGDFNETVFVGWGILGIYFVLALVLLGVCLVLYKKRRMEAAEDAIAVLQLKPVFRFFCSLGAAFTLGQLLYSMLGNSLGNGLSGIGSAVVMLIFMGISAVAGYFAAEMMLKKSLRVFKRASIDLFVVLGILLIFIFGSSLDLFGFEKKIPEKSEIKNAVLSHQSIDFKSDNPETIDEVLALHEYIIESKESYAEEFEAIDNFHWVSVRIEYALNNGKRLNRRYMLKRDYDNPISDSATGKTIEKIQSPVFTAESVKKLLEVPKNNFFEASLDWFDKYDAYTLHLSSEEAYALFNDVIYPDILEGKVTIVDYVEQSLVTAYISARDVKNEVHYSFSFMPVRYEGRLYEYFEEAKKSDDIVHDDRSKDYDEIEY